MSNWVAILGDKVASKPVALRLTFLTFGSYCRFVDEVCQRNVV